MLSPLAAKLVQQMDSPNKKAVFITDTLPLLVLINFHVPTSPKQ